MPIYIYTCCGELPNGVDNRHDCPECGKKNAYDFDGTISATGDQRHGMKHSVEGIRNYYDVGAGQHFGSSDQRKAWLRESGYRPAKSASMYETW